MNPNFWGPHAWIFLHTISMNYPKEPTEENKQTYYQFFKGLEDILPCEKCAYNYSNNLQKHPLEESLESRDSLVRWLIQIHNEVNKETGKPPYTYEQVIEDYKYKMEKLGSDETLVYKVIIVALLLFIGYRYYLQK